MVLKIGLILFYAKYNFILFILILWRNMSDVFQTACDRLTPTYSIYRQKLIHKNKPQFSQRQSASVCERPFWKENSQIRSLLPLEFWQRSQHLKMLLYIFQGTKVCNQMSQDLNINSTHFSSNNTLPSILILYIYMLTVNQQLTHLCLLLFWQRNFKRNICDKVDAKALADGCNKPTDSKADKCSKCSDFAA